MAKGFEEYATDVHNMPNTGRFANFVKKGFHRNMKYLALNTQVDYPQTATGEHAPFTNLTPMDGHLEEIVLFRDDRCINMNDENMKDRNVSGSIDFEVLVKVMDKWDGIGEAFNNCITNLST